MQTMPSCRRLLLLLCYVAVSGTYVQIVAADTCFCLKPATLPDYSTHVLKCTTVSRKLVCPGPLKEPLFRAILMLNVTGVKTALKSGAGVNATSSYEYIRGLTPLHVALLTTSEPFWHPYTEEVYVIIKALLDAHANPNTPFPPGTYQGSQEYDGMTPLQYAAHDGQLQLVQMFIRAGAAVTARGRGGQTALHEAAKCPLDAYSGEKRMPEVYLNAQYAEIIAALLKAGANLHAMDDKGNMPLQLTPDYTTNCEGSSLFGVTCSSVCQMARDGTVPWLEQGGSYSASQYNASVPVKKGDCCSDPDTNEATVKAIGLNSSSCCLAHNGIVGAAGNTA